ncbi:MAG: hypothetical protein QOJ64_2275 [Acidobacteriota bacterium]|nr:hypothetical protein [Acidobacteriota bacterium]
MKKESRRAHNPVRGSTERAFKKAGSLAPPEERSGVEKQGNSNNGGSLEMDTAELKFPKDLADGQNPQSTILGLEPVAIVILVLALVFIAYITYQISNEPDKGSNQPTTVNDTQR